jgi:UPF0755 protein
MAFIKNSSCSVLTFVAAVLGFGYWAREPITTDGEPVIDFTIAPGSTGSEAAQQIAAAGVPVNPLPVLDPGAADAKERQDQGRYL